MSRSRKSGTVPSLLSVGNRTAEIRECARFVVVMERDGSVTVIDNGYRLERKLPCAYMIAVVGWTVHEGVETETVLLEMTYHKHRPYREICSRTLPDPGGRSRWRIRPRTRIARLTPDDIDKVYPELCACIRSIVLECRWYWKSKAKRFIKGRSFDFHAGIFFTVSLEDEWLYRQLILEYDRYMERVGVITRHIRCIGWWIGKHSLKMLEQRSNLKGAVKLAEMLGYYQDPIHQALMLYRLGEKELLREKLLLVGRMKRYGRMTRRSTKCIGC